MEQIRNFKLKSRKYSYDRAVDVDGKRTVISVGIAFNDVDGTFSIPQKLTTKNVSRNPSQRAVVSQLIQEMRNEAEEVCLMLNSKWNNANEGTTRQQRLPLRDELEEDLEDNDAETGDEAEEGFGQYEQENYSQAERYGNKFAGLPGVVDTEADPDGGPDDEGQPDEQPYSQAEDFDGDDDDEPRDDVQLDLAAPAKKAKRTRKPRPKKGSSPVPDEAGQEAEPEEVEQDSPGW